MSKITPARNASSIADAGGEKQLIESLRQLKEIKPRREWAVLLKSEILAENQVEAKSPASQIGNFGFWNFIRNSKFGILHSRQLAYSFATLVFVIVGLIGFAQYTVPGDLLFPIKKISEQSEAALTGQTGIRQNVTTLNNRINDLAQAAKVGKKDNISSAMSEVTANVKDLAQNLKSNPVKDTQTLKAIASSLKVLADVPGTDLKDNQEVKSLYQTLVESQIIDLQETTLTDEQKTSLTEAEKLYNEGEYIEALEVILLIKK